MAWSARRRRDTLPAVIEIMAEIRTLARLRRDGPSRGCRWANLRTYGFELLIRKALDNGWQQAFLHLARLCRLCRRAQGGGAGHDAAIRAGPARRCGRWPRPIRRWPRCRSGATTATATRADCAYRRTSDDHLRPGLRRRCRCTNRSGWRRITSCMWPCAMRARMAGDGRAVRRAVRCRGSIPSPPTRW